MTGAAGRILIDHKDTPNARYIATLSTSNAVFAIQSIVIALLGLVLAAPLAQLFDLPEVYREQFTKLIMLASIIAALGILIRFSGALLYAHQRLDLLSFSSVFATAGGLLAMWVSLAAGAGLYALIISQFTAWIIGALYGIGYCLKLKLFQWSHLATGISGARAKELLHFGKDMFAFNLGSQLLDASQIMIVTKTMGLPSAAIWAVSSKLFTLAFLVVARMQGVAMVYFAEMIVRHEAYRLQTRFRSVYQLSTSLAVFTVIVVIAVNSAFVNVWADASLVWSTVCNLLFAVLIVLNSALRCSAELIIHTKQMAGLRYIYFLEGIIFVILGLVLSSLAGFVGLLVAALICALLFRGLYVTTKAAQYLRISASTLAFAVPKRPILTGLFLVPISIFIANFVVPWEVSSLTSFLMRACSVIPLTALVFLRFSLSHELRSELYKRLLGTLPKHLIRFIS